MAGNKVPSVSSVAENCKSDDGRLRKRVTRSRGDEEKREAIYKICVMQGNIGGMEKNNKRRKKLFERGRLKTIHVALRIGDCQLDAPGLESASTRRE
jgi:hypothetical protein